MAWVRGRRRDAIRLPHGGVLDMRCLDEALFALSGVFDFRAVLRRGLDGDTLHVTLFATGPGDRLQLQADAALDEIAAVRAARADGTLQVAPMSIEMGYDWMDSATKRKIMDERTC